MSKKINLEVIDQMYSAQMSMNASEETIKALRPQVEQAVEKLIRQQGKPKLWTGTIEYHGFQIIVRRPTSYTWHQNNKIKGDPTLEYYKQLYAYYAQLKENTKEARADLRRTGDKLAKAYPESESIKHGLTITLL